MVRTDRGKELLQVVDLSKGGKPHKGEPDTGSFQVRVKRSVNYCGDPDAALTALEASFKGCKFAWAKDE